MRPYTLLQRAALVLVLSSCPSFAAFQRIHAPDPRDPMAVEVFRLDNGLTVYLSENHETPRFSARIAVRAGSKHDPAESTGLAHYLEHLLFKGTTQLGTIDFEAERPHLERIAALYEQHFRETDPERRAAIYEEINRENQLAAQYAVPNEVDRLYNAMGAEGFNAYTWHEQTVYQVNLPINRLSQWAVIEAERFRQPIFRLFQPELEVVYEEKNRSLDNRDRLIGEAVDRLLFKRHPYGQQTTIGEVEHLKNPSLVNVQAYYDRNYVPGNMAIAISGAIDIDETIRLIDEHFSAWPARPVPEQPSWSEDPLRGAERVTVRYPGEEYVLLGFRLPGRNHPDADALKFVDMILDNSVAGLINLNLGQRQLVRGAGSWPEFLNDFGGQFLWGTPKEGQTLAEVEALLLEQVEHLKRGEFPDWLVPAILTDFGKMRKSAFESDDQRAELMVNAFIGSQEWDYVSGELDRLARLTKADIVRAANRYLGTDYVAGNRIDEKQDIPQIEKPGIDPIEIDPTRESAFARRVESMPVAPIEPEWIEPGRDYRRLPAGDGVTFTYVPNPVNDLFSLGITIDIGSRHDMRLPIAAELLDKAGTPRLDATALKEEWYRLGADFGITVGENETRITLSGPDSNLGPAWNLMFELLTAPQVDAETLEELKAILLAQRADAKKDFRTVIQALRQYNRYGTNSLYLRALTDVQLQALTVTELQGLVRGLTQYHRSVDYSGTVPEADVRAVITRVPESSTPRVAPPPYRQFAITAPQRDRVLVFDQAQAQAQVYIEYGDGLFDESATPLVNLFNDYFWGSMSGIVFQELREARALAYDAAGIYSAGARRNEQNLVIGYIGSQADKTTEALSAFLGLFNDMPASGDRFEATRESILSRYRTGKLTFREIAGAVRGWERLEVPIDPRPARFARLQETDLDDVVTFHREHARGRPRLISVLGDVARFDLESLRATADVEVMELNQLFSY